MTDLDPSADVVDRHHVLPASWVLATDRFERCQDIRVEWMSAERCWLLLFVSHRWEDPDHPDPRGVQFRAVRTIVSKLCDLVDALHAPSLGTRLRTVPGLARVGTLQAAVLLSRLALPDLGAASEEPGWAHRVLPDHIGLWYDYACLPQRPRSVDEEASFVAAMLDLPSLFRSERVHLLALREAADDYSDRAWCLAESLLTANRIVQRGIAVRVDRLDERLLPEAAGSDGAHGLRQRLVASLRGWQTTPDPNVAGECLLHAATVVGHSGREWFRADDGIDPVHTGAPVARSIVWMGSVLGAVGRARGTALDLSETLRELATRAGVRCSDDNDLVLVTLLILEGLADPGGTIATFYRRCVAAHLDGRRLQVRRDAGGDLDYDLLELDDG